MHELDAGAKPISHEFLEEGHQLVVAFLSNLRQARFKGGKARVGEFDLAFFEVQAYNRTAYRGVDLRDSDGEIVDPISPESGRNYRRIHSPEGNDVFRIEDTENAWQLTHTSLGVLQDSVRVYPRIPETQTHPGFTWAAADQPNPTDGDRFGYVSGAQVAYENPPAALQALSYKSGDTSVFQYGFYNESSTKQIVPRFNVVGRTYRVVPITKAEEQARALQRASGIDPTAHLLTFGPVTDNFTINLPDEWQDVDAVRSKTGPINGGGSDEPPVEPREVFDGLRGTQR